MRHQGKRSSGMHIMLGMLAVLCMIMVFGGTNAMASQPENTETTTESYAKPGKTKVSGKYSKKGIKLTWDKVKTADTYYVYKKNTKGKYVQIATTKKLTYTDMSVKKGKYYSYKVVASYQVEEQIIKGKYSKECKVLADTIDPKKKMVALTFDDGPGPYTKAIVNCLKKNDGKATFFVLGQKVDSYKDTVKEAYKIGCEIGNHSYDHSNLANLSEAGIKEQMQKTDKKVKKVTGKNTTVMRPPYGSTSSNVKSSVGKPLILWSIDTLDWKTRSKNKTVSAVMNNVKDGDIILMHDIHEPTKEAALTLIPKLRKQGYQLVTVSELAKYRGYKLTKGRTYSSLRKKK